MGYQVSKGEVWAPICKNPKHEKLDNRRKFCLKCWSSLDDEGKHVRAPDGATSCKRVCTDMYASQHILVFLTFRSQ